MQLPGSAMLIQKVSLTGKNLSRLPTNRAWQSW